MKFGIIGCGRIAGTHAREMVKRGQLVAVCDIDEEKARGMGALYSVPYYLDAETLMNNHPGIDVIAVCSPNGLHAKHTVAALKKGFHVLCEKPMALSVADCREMIALARQGKKKLFVVKQNRFNPPVIVLKTLMMDGRLGKVLSFQLNCFWNRGPEYYENSWHGTTDLDGGTLFTQFSHFVDLMYWLLGDVDEIQALMGNMAHQNIIDFEDTGAVVLRMASGAIGTINFTVNSFERNMEGSLTVFAEKGTCKIGGQYLNTLEYQNIDNYRIPTPEAGNLANNYGTYVGSMSNHDKVYDNLLEVLQHNGTMQTSPEEALKTVEIINRIYGAANCNFRTN